MFPMLFNTSPKATVLPMYTEKQGSSASPLNSLSRPIRVRLAAGLLVFLLTLSSYALITSRPLFGATTKAYSQRPGWRPTRVSRPAVTKPAFEFTPFQELAAITSFITALPSNMIPPFVNPSTPIDPQLVLGFDVARHPEEMTVVEDDVWTRHPVVLYSKYYSAQSRSAKAQLTSLELNPAPTFIDVDTRDDASILAPILARLTETSELPILVIGGHVLRPASSSLGLDTLIESLHHSGELDAIMADAGAIVGGTHKVAVKQPVQADPRKPKVKKEMSEAERIFRGLISI
ncbi:hypothetical protein PC9H_007112 [Pleurotus ostreatus]|uniref:Uncharacterized protein n=1 Tax=Pleurotus ostreatus TaxID=5322 RepID=A0A8H7DSF8_PLEOS|nr:uncharacterized protein PC9H_007112 [Pleurotus ostreatus]KAF7427895.1 hypothetical protein PC9H_007112 [Pleurotus ostreatus]